VWKLILNSILVFQFFILPVQAKVQHSKQFSTTHYSTKYLDSVTLIKYIESKLKSKEYAKSINEFEKKHLKNSKNKFDLKKQNFHFSYDEEHLLIVGL
jgi:hypothetical protein